MRKVVTAVLVYLERDGRILMLHRNRKPEDFHKDKWNGLGGKLEPDESPLECAAREVAEESGIKLAEERFRVVGVLQFPNFKAQKNEDWLCFVLKASVTEEDTRGLVAHGPEGDLEWIARDRVLELPLWEGDRVFIPHVLAGRSFIGTFWYRDGRLARQWLQPF